MSEATPTPQSQPAAPAAAPAAGAPAEAKTPAPAAAAAGDKAAAKQAATPAAPRAAFQLPPVVVMLGVVALALGAGVAAGTLVVAPRVIQARLVAARQAADPSYRKAHRKDRNKDKKDKKGETGKSPVYRLDNIIVNPAGSQGQRFLMCSVAIESDDSRALDVLREHEIELRDHVVTLLSQQTLERLTSQNARDSIRTELLAIIRPALGPDADDTDLKVFLPQFVVQ